jgi:peroxiredoxin family protein
MKTIETLVQDIHNVFQMPHEFSPERLERFSKRLAASVVRKVNPEERVFKLSMSSIGTRCNRKLWYKKNKPGDAESLPVEAKIKFMYGDILEELLLFFAEEAGHSVTGCQDKVELHGITGHRDAVIDGVVVDVKSASTFSFQKFKKGLTYADDSFGYVDQLQGYLKAADDDPLVTDKSRAAFLVIDKTLGHITLDIHQRSNLDFAVLAKVKTAAVERPMPPDRQYELEPEGKSGNLKLCMECSYCDFKRSCYPGLRTFIYSRGPVHLAVVKKEPDVVEAKPF